MYGTISENTTSNPQVQDIPIGIPKLAPVESQEYFDILRRWLEDCDNNHEGCKPEDTDSAFGTLPTRLISVREKDSKIVRLLETQHSYISPDRRYIALSHPWGDGSEHNHYCTTKLSLPNHKIGIPINALPNTFQNAIEVTRQLGVQYLWIDSLCIMQGEDGDFEDEAKHMETVFSLAYCVIAATCAKGMSSGFFKTRPDRKVVRFKKPGEPAFYVCESIDNFQKDVIEGTLNTRGWVLQERALARRTIYFAENQTYWECGEGVRCETLIRMRNKQAALLGDPKFPGVATNSSKGGRIYLYELLYKQYSRLQFTRIIDRPLAIAGIEQRLIRAFNSQGGYGVFTHFFGRGLLWQRDVKSPSQTMKPIRFPESQRYQVPSWSWMAYEGAIDFMELPFGGIEWEKEEIYSPWSHPSPILPSVSRESIIPNTSWHTAETNGRNDLKAVARDFSALAHPDIVYDKGERPENRIVKCVIVGRKKMITGLKSDRIHYVLVVARKQDAISQATYERVGVGALPEKLITIRGPGLRVQVV
ncbi:heterokaryon incompatibility protein-domain-containing protein [Hypoxylon argillaceum]|nr:heterokaryon incompatibility protein-domain-containing protein [Hypoxylon argillaceum]